MAGRLLLRAADSFGGNARWRSAQRAAKMQPGIASFSDGTTPGISASRAWPPPVKEERNRGTDVEEARV